MKPITFMVGALCLCAWARVNDTEYQPQTQLIRYQSGVPPTIRRATKKVGPTRFYGVFKRGARTFAVHLYDQTYISSNTRQSRVDVWQQDGNKWRIFQSFPFVRQVASKRDGLQISAENLWLDPTRRVAPMMHLHIAEKTNIPEVGRRTDVYGVLEENVGSESFIALEGDVPYSDSTVTLSQISFPDTLGRLTLLDIISDPGATSYTAYGWREKSWQIVGQTTFDNSYEAAKRWNGGAFVPLANAN